ncbi:MAG: SpoIID/LytB domain-containing protein [Armatimonadota bacterium]
MRIVSAILLALICTHGSAAPRQVIHVGIWPGARMPNSVTVTGELAISAAGKQWKESRLHCVVTGTSISAIGLGQASTIRIDSENTITVQADQRLFTARGALRLSAANGHISCDFILPLEDYTARVLTREMPIDWPPQALAAQAVVARSYALNSKNRHRNEGFDVCALTHCQLVSATPPPQVANQAARQTTGQVLSIAGQPVAPPFHSTCGGATADGGKIGMAAWCESISDNHACQQSPHYRWKARLTYNEIASIFRLGLDNHRQAGLNITQKDAGGHVVQIVGNGRTKKSLNGGQFLMACGRTLGWARIKSCLFTSTKTANGYLITGRGLGHGVGMCQWGARGIAENGRSWQQILKTYYPKAQPKRL